MLSNCQMPTSALAADYLQARGAGPAAAGAGPRALPIEQFLRLRRQLPRMYLILAMNAATLAYTHNGMAPAWLAVYLPCVLIAICCIRLAQWLRPIAEEGVTAAFAARMLRRTEVLASTLSVGFVSWALLLDQYGGANEHGHVTVFVAITVMGCIFCLTYLPKAAYTVCFVVLGVFLTYCIARGTLTLTAMAMNILMVGLVVLTVLRDSYKSFTTVLESRVALQRERLQAQRLAEENAKLAHSDALTGLPNRRYFFARLDAMLARADRAQPFCIGVFDLDRFKPIQRHAWPCAR